MKKVLSLILVTVLCFGMFSCSTAEDNQNKVIEQKPMVVVITDVGGIGDHSFNDATLAALEKVKDDEDIDIRCLESESVRDYDSVIKEAVNEDATLIIAVGSNMKNAINKAAMANPDKHFGIIDANIDAENIKSVSFADNESAFLAGYVAASNSKTGVIGFVGGEERPTVDLFKYGYMAGAKAANPNIKVETEYVGTFYNDDKCYDIATKMHKDKKADVIMHVAGASGLGVIKSAKDNKYWAIGADKDQSHLASNNVLCSATKNMEPALEQMVKMALKNKFEGEYVLYNLKDEGVILSDNAGNIKGDLKDQIKELTKAIENGDINVPFDMEGVNSFELPDNLKAKTKEDEK